MRATRTVGMLFLLLCCMGSILAQQPFTYQGMLKTSGIPASGNYDFQFSLWTASSSGSQVGSTVTRIGVSVGNGLFTTELDFGSVWDGNERYLQIAVRPSGSGSYTTLSPRVKVNRVPYSQLAFGALSVPWSGIVGIPAGFADGVDNDTAYSAGAGLQLVGNTFSIASGGVVSAMLADGSVVTGKIANGAVTTDKLADGAVTTAKIGDGQVTDAKIASVSWSKVTGAPSSFPPGGSAGGDLSGSYPNPTVAKLQGRAVASTAPSAGQVLKWNGSAWTPDTDLRDAFWQASGSHIYYIAGNVGIGTNSPETRLHVLAGSAGTVTADANSVLTIERNDRAYLSILTPDAAERGILFGQPSSNVAGGILYNSSATLNGFQFRTNGNTTRMVIDGSGNVGIGLTGPEAKLHIRNGNLRVDNGEIQSWGTITLHPDVDNSGDDIVAFVNSAGTEVMRVHSNGNVGIGTPTPAYALDVSGDVRWSGTLQGGTVPWARISGAPNFLTSVATTPRFSGNGTAGSPLELAQQGASTGQVLKWNGSAWTPDTDLRDAFWQASGSSIFYTAGKVGIGTNSPETRLHVLAGSAGTVTADANSVLTIEHNDRAYLSILTPDTTERGILFGQPSSNAAGGVIYNSSATPNGLQFRTNGNLTRMVVDGSGNVGIGTSNPWYPLHVETNAGDCAIYGKNTAASGFNYGVMGQSASTSGRGVYGYAFANNGTTYGVLGKSDSPSGYGVYSLGNFAAAGAKLFQIDHPLSPETHYLNHFCTEGPEPYNAYSGNVVTDAQGYAVVQLPDYFESINRDFRYQLTVIDGAGEEFVQARVVRKIQNNQFVIRTSKPFVEVSWEVKAVRNDRWVQEYGFQTEPEKPKEHQGRYLNPELYGQPKEQGIHYHPELEREVTPVEPVRQ